VNITPSIAASTDVANVVHSVNYNIIRDQMSGIVFGFLRTILCVFRCYCQVFVSAKRAVHCYSAWRVVIRSIDAPVGRGGVESCAGRAL